MYELDLWVVHQFIPLNNLKAIELNDLVMNSFQLIISY